MEELSYTENLQTEMVNFLQEHLLFLRNNIEGNAIYSVNDSTPIIFAKFVALLENANDTLCCLHKVTETENTVNTLYTHTVIGYTGESLLIAVAKLLGIEVSLNTNIIGDGKRMQINANIIWNSIIPGLWNHYSQ
jgi:hypothetical protein